MRVELSPRLHLSFIHETKPLLRGCCSNVLDSRHLTVSCANADPTSQHQQRQKRVKYTQEETLGYAAARMPGCYSVASRVLDDLRWRLPEFQPGSLLDFGAGPGTATWAASQVCTAPRALSHSNVGKESHSSTA